MDRSLRDAERSGDGAKLLKAKMHAGQLTPAMLERGEDVAVRQALRRIRKVSE